MQTVSELAVAVAEYSENVEASSSEEKALGEEEEQVVDWNGLLEQYPESEGGVESPQVTETKEKVETNWSQAGELEEGVQITQNGLVHLEIQQIEDGDSAAIGSSKEENEAQSPTSHHEGQDDSVANVHRYFMQLY
jgi:hypothetical protein